MISTFSMMQQQHWLESIAAVLFLHISILLIHLLCPAFTVDGYVCDVVNFKKPLSYRLNGLACLLISVSLFFLIYYSSESNDAVTFLAKNFLACAMVSNVLGLLASFYLVYVRFPSLSKGVQKANAYRRAPTVTLATVMASTDKAKKVETATRTGDYDDRTPAFYWGLEFTPRYNVFGSITFDVKMFLYVVGAVILELNVLSALLLERINRGTNSLAMVTYTALMTWFVCEYLYFERIHLYTYDLFAEKVGFKLAWGCCCFYPFFYAIGMLPMVWHSSTMTAQEDISSAQAMGTILCFYSGWMLTRGANLQKYYFRRFPGSPTVFFGLVRQETLPSSKNRILCAGFWGMARHVNYFGEIVQGLALALPGSLMTSGDIDGGDTTILLIRFIPFLYPIYYTLLFIYRQIDDDALMRRRYGDEVMDEYVRKVPYRMVPGVY